MLLPKATPVGLAGEEPNEPKDDEPKAGAVAVENAPFGEPKLAVAPNEEEPNAGAVEAAAAPKPWFAPNAELPNAGAGAAAAAPKPPKPPPVRGVIVLATP